jgi:hypothetical protein
MNIKQKIGWQKYEDMLEQQMQSPLLASLYKTFYENMYEEEDITSNFTEEEIEELMESQREQYPQTNQTSANTQDVMIPVDDELVKNVNLIASFDCWMGYTNFNITEDVKDKLDSTEGVEVLKVLSRYRFFVGVGRMFDFKDVRRKIEQTIINKGKKIE